MVYNKHPGVCQSDERQRGRRPKASLRLPRRECLFPLEAHTINRLNDTSIYPGTYETDTDIGTGTEALGYETSGCPVCFPRVEVDTKREGNKFSHIRGVRLIR